MSVKRGIIPVDPRHTARNIRAATQGNPIRALVELITNADDSYTRLEDASIQTEGIIEILYQKAGGDCRFAVRDFAEGMTSTRLLEIIPYGAPTSGMSAGQKVRGYFGQGAKDALVSMKDGVLYTFKNDGFGECKLYLEKGVPQYQLRDLPASDLLRHKHGISGDGTIARFKVPPRIPRFDTVHKELANNFHLRKILTNRRRKVTLHDESSGRKRRIRFEMPQGTEVLRDEFMVPCGERPDLRVRMSVLRCKSGDLTQSGDDRNGGLLLLDDMNVVLGISLFKYDAEPLAARLFGEVQIDGFRALLDDEEPVLRDDREGLDCRHPFCKQLVTEIEGRLGKLVDEERARRQREDQSKLDREEAGRYRKAFRILNDIAAAEAPDVINLGPQVPSDVEDPPNGFALYPPTAQITVGKRYNLQLRVSTNTIRRAGVVRLSSSCPKIRLVTREVMIPPNLPEKVLVKHVTIEGLEPDAEGVLQAALDDHIAESKIYVVPEKEFLLTEGLVFQPQSITLRPNHPKRVHLHVYTKIVGGGSEIRLNSDNPAVQVSVEQIVVNETEAVRHVATYPIEIWGDGPGQQALITAEWENYIALLEVTVKSKDDSEQDKGPHGMFSEPEYDFDPKPLQRTRYSRETGKVVVYVCFPSVKHYLGEARQYAKTLAAQVFVADLVAERCFYEIARRKVEVGGALLPGSQHDRIQRDAFELSGKYGRKVHEALVDQGLLKSSRNTSG